VNGILGAVLRERQAAEAGASGVVNGETSA
jgi:hypothetical protein